MTLGEMQEAILMSLQMLPLTNHILALFPAAYIAADNISIALYQFKMSVFSS